jgi:hypothetical protein
VNDEGLVSSQQLTRHQHDAGLTTHSSSALVASCRPLFAHAIHACAAGRPAEVYVGHPIPLGNTTRGIVGGGEHLRALEAPPRPSGLS